MEERDSKTKALFIQYLKDHKSERFFQAIRNFTNENIEKTNFIHHSVDNQTFNDTFYWECDSKLKDKNEL